MSERADGSGSAVAQPREVLALAVPAFLALVAEPLFLLVDSAVVGRLGVVPLAGLGAASAVLLTVAGIFVFLAYGTTSVVARRMGAGREAEAVETGLAGVWLAVGLGVVTAAVVAAGAAPFVGRVVSSPAALEQAVTYLRISALGLPAMLVALATTGILRGLLDTRTPLVVATLGFGANAALSVLLVLVAGLGIAGAAWGTVVAQTGMALALTAVVLRHARRVGASVRPHPGRVLSAALGGVPLVVRTLALRGVLLLLVAGAASFGDVPLAAHQVTATVWTFLTFALDALAIAAQALTGRALGAGDVARARASTALMVRWGVLGGAVLGALVLAMHTVLPTLFTQDEDLRRAIAAGLVVVALGTPLAGYVFVLDGVLLGAGDNRYLSVSMVLLLGLTVPVVLLAQALVPRLGGPDAGGGGRDGGCTGATIPLLGEVSPAGVAVMSLWVAMTVFMAMRGGLLGARLRGEGWAVVGADRGGRS